MCLLPPRPLHPHPPQCVLPSLHLEWQDLPWGLKSGDLHGSMASELSRCVFCLLGQLAAGLLSAFNDPSTGHVAGTPLPVLLFLSLFPASLGTEKEDGGAPGWETSPPCPAAVPGVGVQSGHCSTRLSDSLQSAVPRVLFLASRPSPTFQSLCSLSVSSIVCVCHLPFSAAPSACLGSSGCCLLGGESTVFCPQGSLGAVPDPRAGLPLARGHPHTQPGAQPGSRQLCSPLAQGGVTLELPGPVCLAVMQTS